MLFIIFFLGYVKAQLHVYLTVYLTHLAPPIPNPMTCPKPILWLIFYFLARGLVLERVFFGEAPVSLLLSRLRFLEGTSFFISGILLFMVILFIIFSAVELFAAFFGFDGIFAFSVPTLDFPFFVVGVFKVGMSSSPRFTGLVFFSRFSVDFFAVCSFPFEIEVLFVFLEDPVVAFPFESEGCFDFLEDSVVVVFSISFFISSGEIFLGAVLGSVGLSFFIIGFFAVSSTAFFFLSI
mmetsp:Transcript_64307/g.74063  ORF Transcript_64307/g.74063 Transcript_64307/m.74063 type:complete len:237 (-) Transcript_64307:1300-2010(-)